jgi:transcriptional repressor NrdR
MEPGLRCPHCNRIDEGKVIETIKVDEGVRRRYRCKVCEGIFPSYEYVGVKQMLVEKRSGKPEVFRRDKVKTGIELAFAKLDIEEEYIEAITDRVVSLIHTTGKRAVSSEFIGRMVLEELLRDAHPASKVAFLRFASVFLYIRDYTSFQSLVEDTTAKLQTSPAQLLAEVD